MFPAIVELEHIISPKQSIPRRSLLTKLSMIGKPEKRRIGAAKYQRLPHIAYTRKVEKTERGKRRCLKYIQLDSRVHGTYWSKLSAIEAATDALQLDI